ncbi:helix-turn-helix domain-containing protein [Streptomyces xiangluensis]|uniref:Helix-turn-helix domain-containing protein n=1 Tax=Streptomyces xiangluensis TaxID=2665720 RepID=A0ABV8YED3_9ACTN
MGVVTSVHSIPAQVQTAPCESVSRPPHPRLSPFVLGYSGFRAGSGSAVRHRVLPVNLTALIIDVTGASRLVTGARADYEIHTSYRWREGVAVGLTPAGSAALLGAPARWFLGESVELADVLGAREAELAERLAAAPDWASRFTVLDEQLTAWLDTRNPVDDLVTRAWLRLQRPGPRTGVEALAARLGVSRRYLQVRFQREIGLPPRSVARIARLQRTVGRLVAAEDLARIAAECGYADQPHFTREIREMTGLSPTGLCANLQYRELDAR